MAYNAALPRLLRNLARGLDHIKHGHDMIFIAAAEELERARESISLLEEIREALEKRGYAHFTNGRSIGEIVDRLEYLETVRKQQAAEEKEVKQFLERRRNRRIARRVPK